MVGFYRMTLSPILGQKFGPWVYDFTFLSKGPPCWYIVVLFLYTITIISGRCFHGCQYRNLLVYVRKIPDNLCPSNCDFARFSFSKVPEKTLII